MKSLTLALLALAAGSSAPAKAIQKPQPVDVELWRLDCGSFPQFPMDGLSDDDRYRGQRRDLSNGCYLIRHGKDYMLWDAGLPVAPEGSAKHSVIDQLAQIGVRPDQVRYLAISHLHPDHIAQAADFPKAELLIGAADWATAKSPPSWSIASLKPWISGGARVEEILKDKDIFGDGTVRMIATPGHTPGHHSLIIQLRKSGVVMLTGDLFHVRESYDRDVVPIGNDSRAETLASIDRFKRLAARYKATVVIQHESRDIAKLPAFPQGAR